VLDEQVDQPVIERDRPRRVRLRVGPLRAALDLRNRLFDDESPTFRLDALSIPPLHGFPESHA
jgi:hypothetical protein